MAPSPYVPVAQAAAAKYGIPEPILLHQINEESGWNPHAVSSAGAQGLMQLMPGTAHGLGVTDPYNPVQNIDAGARYLREQYDHFGSWQKALAAYNAGPGNVENGAWQSMPGVLRYVQNILAGGSFGAPGKGAPAQHQAPNGRIPSTNAISNADFNVLMKIAEGGTPSPLDLVNMEQQPAAASPLAGLPAPAQVAGNFANPIPDSSFARVDQGVDFNSHAPVRAFEGATVESVSKGMAGGTGDIIKLKLDHPVSVNGHTYDQIYYSEETPLVHQGEHVAAGQPVMGPGGNELGFLDQHGQMAPLVGGLGAGTQPTTMGADFLAFLRRLGIKT